MKYIRFSRFEILKSSKLVSTLQIDQQSLKFLRFKKSCIVKFTEFDSFEKSILSILDISVVLKFLIFLKFLEFLKSLKSSIILNTQV